MKEREVLVAIDPSLNAPGIAIFLDGRLGTAFGLKTKTSAKDPLAKRVRYTLKTIAQAVDSCLLVTKASRVVIEIPQVYNHKTSKADPADLITLALVAGGVSIGPFAKSSAVFEYVTPAQWAGQVPKNTKGDPWASARGIRVYNKLDAEEKARANSSDNLNHDAVDAIGIGLHALGRLKAPVISRGEKPDHACE